jgi:hypothetical protein
MREQVLGGTCFVCSRSINSGLSLDELSNLLSGSRGNKILTKIIQHTQKLMGTRPF